MPELAKSAELLLNLDNSGELLVDGEEFPFYILANDITVETVTPGVRTLRLSVLIDGPVTVNGDLVDEFEVR